MIKKLAVGGLLALVAMHFIFGRDARSYVRTGMTAVRQAVKSEVPLEFELDRARQLVDQLMPEVRNCMHVVAEQQVDIEGLKASLARRGAELDGQKAKILALRSELSGGKPQVQLAGHTYTSAAVERDLANRFARYRDAEVVLTNDQKILTAREQTLVANREKLQGMLAARRELQVKVEQLAARLETLRAAETVNKLTIDDSQLSHTRRMLDDLGKRLDVRQRVLDAEGEFNGLIPFESVEETPAENVGEQIDKFFKPSAVQPENTLSAVPPRLAGVE